MSQSKSSPVTGNVNQDKNSKTRAKGKKPKEVMSKHIRDKNDVISDEDFKNLDINADLSDTAHIPVELDNDKERPKDEEKDHKTVTPWDVIN